MSAKHRHSAWDMSQQLLLSLECVSQPGCLLKSATHPDAGWVVYYVHNVCLMPLPLLPSLRYHFSGENSPPPLLHSVFVIVSCDVFTLGP